MIKDDKNLDNFVRHISDEEDNYEIVWVTKFFTAFKEFDIFAKEGA